MSDNIAVKVEHVSKQFRLPTESSSSLRTTLVNYFKGIKGYKEQQVLNDISFEVEKGDFFGIVGRNGSGKSTLLKIISQIYVPEKGSVTIDGKLVSFIELGVGFNPELTGRENVYLNEALLGFSTEEIDGMYDDIVNFAELGEFMNQKLKNYSSGMQVRLAFSVAIQAKSDILVLDEILAVGDEAFQRKCYNYFSVLKKEKRTVILVTHSMDSVQQFCNKAILIEDGEIIKRGKTSEVAKGYRELFLSEDTKVSQKDDGQGQENTLFSVTVDSEIDKENLALDITLNAHETIEDAVITLTMNKDSGEQVYRWVSDEKVSQILSFKKDRSLKLALQLQNIFPDGVFEIELGIKKRDRTVEYAKFTTIHSFEVIHQSEWQWDTLWKPEEVYQISQED